MGGASITTQSDNGDVGSLEDWWAGADAFTTWWASADLAAFVGAGSYADLSLVQPDANMFGPSFDIPFAPLDMPPRLGAFGDDRPLSAWGHAPLDSEYV
jgi:hypothetical protein